MSVEIFNDIEVTSQWNSLLFSPTASYLQVKNTGDHPVRCKIHTKLNRWLDGMDFFIESGNTKVFNDNENDITMIEFIATKDSGTLDIFAVLCGRTNSSKQIRFPKEYRQITEPFEISSEQQAQKL